MPRYLPLFADRLAADFQVLLNFLNRLETNHANIQIPNSRITLQGLELAYELSYLKIFLLWEKFQEQVFLRLLMGIHSNGGAETLRPTIASPRTIAAADIMILNGRDFLLWHNPVHVMARADRYFEVIPGYFRSVIRTNEVKLSHYAAVRHRIAHAQDHAETAFNATTMTLAGVRYPGSSAGRFLRDIHVTDPRRWINFIADDLTAIARRFC